jgi:hypothetical protein
MGKRTWLDELLTQTYLPAITALKDTKQGREEAGRLGSELRQGWAERGFTSLIQQQGLMDQTRLTLKQALGEKHFSLELIKFTREEYFELNQGKQVRARDRQMHQQYLQNPDAIVTTAVKLLESLEWAEVAAGLAVLTGRRLNEVLKTAEFTVKSGWVVSFQGALKRRGEGDALVFDIPTLTTAEQVVAAMGRLRGITPENANERQVGKASERWFGNLVPVPAGKETLYSHLWRSVYGCIATFWFCPRHVDDLLFKAHVLGHFEALSTTERENEPLLRQRLETFGSDRHYRLYEIADEVIVDYEGQRKGVRLGRDGVRPLEVFVEGMPEQQLPQPVRRQRSSFRVWRGDHDDLVVLLNRFEGKSQPDKVRAWLLWSRRQLQSDAERQPETTGELAAMTTERTITPPASGVSTPPAIPAAGHGEGTLTESDSVMALTAQMGELVATMRDFMALQIGSSTSTKGQVSPRQRRGDLGHTKGESSTVEITRAGRGRLRGDDDPLIDRALSAILAYNNATGRTHEQKWFITANLLKKFTPKANQRAAERVLTIRADEVQQHHAQHLLQTDHNQRHRKHNPLEVITYE